MRVSITDRNIILVFVALVILASSSVVTIPVAKGSSIPSTPQLNKITYVSYAGSDQSGVADLAAGKIDAYDASLTPSASASLPATYPQYVTPYLLLGLYVNVQNLTSAATGGAVNFNPFYFQKVRFALNYLIDRNYIGQSILGGHFVPGVTPYSSEPDELRTSTVSSIFSNITYNFQFANQTVYNTLHAWSAAHGNVLTYVNHQWYFKGSVVQFGLFDRIDDPTRHAEMAYANSQIQKLGFQTKLIAGDVSAAIQVVFGSDPINATWVIYPGGNGNSYGYYDEGLALGQESCYYEDLPASDHYGLTWVGTNDTFNQEPATTALLDKADTYAIPLLNSDFSTLTQRNGLLGNFTYYGALAASYVSIGTTLNPVGTVPALTNVTPNFVQDALGNYMNYITMDNPSGTSASPTPHTATIGVRSISAGAVNPVGGDFDAYTAANVVGPDVIPLNAPAPATGYLYSAGMTVNVKANTFTPSVAVPTSAYVFNPTQDKFVSVAADTKAQDDVVVDFSKLFGATKWSDGTSMTLADLLMPYIVEGLVVTNGTSLYDAHMSAVYQHPFSSVLGFQVLNATALEVWTKGTFYPDQNIAGFSAAADIADPMGYTTLAGTGAAMTPWQLFVAMDYVVANGQAAWSTASASKLGVDWLSVINTKDVASIKAALQSQSEVLTVPSELLQLQTLSGITLPGLDSTSAAAGYTAAINFIDMNGVAEIGNGPFYISQYSASTSPAFLVQTKNPYFQAGSVANPILFSPSTLLTSQAAIPPLLNPGQSFVVKALATPNGKPSTSATPAAGVDVVVQLVAKGAIQFQASYTTGTDGTVDVTIPSSLPVGSYLMTIYTSSVASTLIQPVIQPITLTAVVTTTTTSTTSHPTTTSTTSHPTTTSITSSPTTASASASTTTSTTSTTSGIDYTPYIYGGIIVIVIVVVIAIALARRRGKGGP